MRKTQTHYLWSPVLRPCCNALYALFVSTKAVKVAPEAEEETRGHFMQATASGLGADLINLALSWPFQIAPGQSLAQGRQTSRLNGNGEASDNMKHLNYGLNLQESDRSAIIPTQVKCLCLYHCWSHSENLHLSYSAPCKQLPIPPAPFVDNPPYNSLHGAPYCRYLCGNGLSLRPPTKPGMCMEGKKGQGS